ncbi:MULTISPECIES: hypothetical protein [Nostoc]|uniref:Secreted protein n=1 Tax=Nostoc paludosum FACHB-159 TaxID=2692908 RepID=A0ABR8JZ17_9NOSO|nr:MULTISPECIES: hypothetical protein [Nostoc]MBD2676284.1 hypothetical protein [Nostoc sp. FACHB-857]MBD2732589.1 hypothetical protein [Nostoc paludosum FACHB-159]
MAKGWLMLSMCWTMTPEIIALPPKPMRHIWIVCSRERSRSVCSISTMPRIESIALLINSKP